MQVINIISFMVQNETIVDILETEGRRSPNLVFTSTRLIIIRNLYGKIMDILMTFAVCAFIFIYPGTFLVGVIRTMLIIIPVILVLIVIGAIFVSKSGKIAESYRKATLESLLSLKHEEIAYSQIEKIEFTFNKNELKLFFVAGRTEKKDFRIVGTMYQQNLDLLNSLFPGKVFVK